MAGALPTDRRELATMAAMVGALVIGAAALRWPGMSRGFTSDEMSMLQPWGLWHILFEAESGVNPPLLRLMFNLPLPDAYTLQVGRYWSFLCSLAGVVMAFFLGRTAGRSSLAGFVCAGIVVILPQAVSQGAIYRSYSTFLLVLLWHLFCVIRWTDGERGRGMSIQVALSAFLLPQLHFVSIPILLVEAAGFLMMSRRSLAMFVPAFLGFAPFAYLIATEPARRVAAPENGIQQAIDNVVGMGDLLWMTDGVFLLAMLLVFRLRPAHRLVLLGAAGLGASMFIFGAMQVVRPPGAIWMLPFFAATVVSLPTVIPQRLGERPRMFVLTVLGLMIIGPVKDRMQHEIRPIEDRDQVLEIARSWHVWRQPGQDIVVDREYFMPTLHFYLTGEHISRAGRREECADIHHCFVFHETRFIGMQGDPESPPSGVWANLECWNPPEPSKGCEVLANDTCLLVQRCP
jgi:hypothetical protein